MKKFTLVMAFILVFSISLNVFAVEESDKIYDENKAWAIGEYTGTPVENGEFYVKVYESDGYFKADVKIIGLLDEPLEFNTDAYVNYDVDDCPDDREIKLYYDHNGPKEVEIEIEFDDGVWEAEVEEEHGLEREFEFLVEKIDADESIEISEELVATEDNSNKDASGSVEIDNEGSNNETTEEIIEDSETVEESSESSPTPNVYFPIALAFGIIALAAIVNRRN